LTPIEIDRWSKPAAVSAVDRAALMEVANVSARAVWRSVIPIAGARCCQIPSITETPENLRRTARTLKRKWSVLIGSTKDRQATRTPVSGTAEEFNSSKETSRVGKP